MNNEQLGLTWKFPLQEEMTLDFSLNVTSLKVGSREESAELSPSRFSALLLFLDASSSNSAPSFPTETRSRAEVGLPEISEMKATS